MSENRVPRKSILGYCMLSPLLSPFPHSHGDKLGYQTSPDMEEPQDSEAATTMRWPGLVSWEVKLLLRQLGPRAVPRTLWRPFRNVDMIWSFTGNCHATIWGHKSSDPHAASMWSLFCSLKNLEKRELVGLYNHGSCGNNKPSPSHHHF
jgi:hypothetical protein